MTTMISSAPAKQRDPGLESRVSLLNQGLIEYKYAPDLAACESRFQTRPVIRYNRALSHHLIIQCVGSVCIVCHYRLHSYFVVWKSTILVFQYFWSDLRVWHICVASPLWGLRWERDIWTDPELLERRESLAEFSFNSDLDQSRAQSEPGSRAAHWTGSHSHN